MPLIRLFLAEKREESRKCQATNRPSNGRLMTIVYLRKLLTLDDSNFLRLINYSFREFCFSNKISSEISSENIIVLKPSDQCQWLDSSGQTASVLISGMPHRLPIRLAQSSLFQFSSEFFLALRIRHQSRARICSGGFSLSCSRYWPQHCMLKRPALNG